jgi:S-adenosylmethionine:diacylglycerol 3-amino-3-carboxypropyl transferase
MSTQLIAEAVFNQRGADETSIWDRVFAIWFRRLVYAQIWEDPKADLATLELAPHARIVPISSGGCNALSYLTAEPQQVYAVDLNDVHLALLNLKIAGLRGFTDYETFWARLLGKSPALLFSLGIPPRQRVLLTAGDAGLDEVLRARVLRLIDHYPTDDNYFAWQALQRRYPGPGNRCLPPYLQQQHFDRIRAQAQSITPVHANVRTLLEALPTRHVDAVVLLDSQDWMAPQEIQSLWQAIDRAGTEGVRVIFRTAGEGSPLAEPELAPLQKTWQRDAERSALGFEKDRSGTYGGFHLYRRR